MNADKMIVSTILLLCSLSFDQSENLLRQIDLDAHGFSCNTIDGAWGVKSERAQKAYTRIAGVPAKPFRKETVTQADLNALTKIPTSPAEKAQLPQMGYETIKEMFAERGHLSQRALERLNPNVDWDNIQPGIQLTIPDFPSIEANLEAGNRRNPLSTKPSDAALIKISLSNFEITVWNATSNCIALFPCSIAKNKAKLPPIGELKITTAIPYPNYTYSPDFVPHGKKPMKYVFPGGPNCPVGVAWLGLNLPGYGIHGTPHPESIGKAESHGCFRLSNWNAARLYAMCKPGTRVIIEP